MWAQDGPSVTKTTFAFPSALPVTDLLSKVQSNAAVVLDIRQERQFLIDLTVSEAVRETRSCEASSRSKLRGHTRRNSQSQSTHGTVVGHRVLLPFPVSFVGPGVLRRPRSYLRVSSSPVRGHTRREWKTLVTSFYEESGTG